MTQARRVAFKGRLERASRIKERARRSGDLALWLRAYHALKRISARYSAETSRDREDA